VAKLLEREGQMARGKWRVANYKLLEREGLMELIIWVILQEEGQ